MPVKLLMKALLSGLLTGLLLQLAVGPVFFYILGITVDSNYTNSLFAVIAVTLADYIYIVLSLIGIGKLLQQEKTKKIFGLISSIVLVLFGIMILYRGLVFINEINQIHTFVWTPINSFTSSFILTISSPLTIVFWSSIFSVIAIEKNYQKKQLVMFGIGTGAATFLFLSLTMMILSLLKSSIPNLIIQIVNCIVGFLLIYYGISRSIRLLFKLEARSILG